MKGKKVKKGKAKKKDTTWEFEGGTAKVDDESEQEQAPRKRSRTQERDERLRRSRHKLHDAKLKRDFASKMSQKVRFSDILKSESQVSEQSDSDAQEEDDNMDVEEVPKVQRPRSNISVLDRLQRLWSHSAGQSNNSSVKNQKSKTNNQDTTKVSSTQMVTDFDTQILLSEDLQLIFHSSATSETNNAQADDNASINDENDDVVNANIASSSTIDYFQDYFSKPLSSIESTSKLTLWQKIIFAEHEYSLLVSKSQKNNIQSFPALTTVQELPGLHKLWRNRSQPLSITSFAKYTLPSLSLYQDVFVEGRDIYDDSVMLETMLMHSLFHVLKARSKVVKHNQKLKQRRRDTAMTSYDDLTNDELASNNKGKSSSRKRKATTDTITSAQPMKALTEEEENAYRDQGFVRPRLLILVPFRHMARSIIEKMITILGKNTSVSGLEKLHTEYGDPVPEDDTTNPFLQGNNKKSKKPVERKPADWEASFQDKNVDDDFRMGIQVNPSQGKGSGAEKGAYLRLYSDFYISDIILASPIGLKLAMETKKNGQSHIDCDFLSSIEQVVIHQADILAMQNWEHLDYLFRHMNLMPRDSHDDTDYARVRPYFLEGQAAKYRQVMITTQGNTPEIQAFFREFALSHAGQMKWRRNWEEGVIGDVFVPVKQVFQVLPRNVTSLAESEERRWLTFQQQILAPILRLRQRRTLIVAPSYLHFVRIRNYLLEQEANAAFLSEYISESEISRSRVMFYQGLKDILLYSGRSHFFRRFRIRGARHVVFYSLPEQAHFYPEIVNMLSLVFEDVKKKKVVDDDADGVVASADDFATEMSCITLCSHYEQMALERILGQKKSEQMLLSDKNAFVFF